MSIAPAIPPPSNVSSHAVPPPLQQIPVQQQPRQSIPFVAANYHQAKPQMTKRIVPAKRKLEPKDLFDEANERYKRMPTYSTIAPPTLKGTNIGALWKKNQLKAIQKMRPQVLANDHGIQMDSFTSMVTDQNFQQSLKLKVWEHAHIRAKDKGKQRKHRQKFFRKLPGPMPVTLTATLVDMLRTSGSEYLVCEKTDGERMMFYIQSYPTDAYFVDRSFRFYQLKNRAYTDMFKQVRGDTLVDGELIKIQGQLFYFIFDAIVVQGEVVRDMDLKMRLKKSEQVIWSLEHYFNERGQQPLPVLFFQKKFFELPDIAALLNRIHKQEGEGEYMYVGSDEGQPNRKNDGVIFTRAPSNYLMREPNALVKWKWFDKNTIDLAVKEPYFDERGYLLLYAGWKQKQLILFTRSQLTRTQQAKFEDLRQEMLFRGHSRDTFIVECAFKADTQFWVPMNNRPDKETPNFITTCTNMMHVLIDCVRGKDLIKAFERNI